MAKLFVIPCGSACGRDAELEGPPRSNMVYFCPVCAERFGKTCMTKPFSLSSINPPEPRPVMSPKQHATLTEALSQQARATTYENLGRDIGKLVAEKQNAYGDSFGKAGEVMCILYPDGITVDKLDDALTVVRVVDKLFRIATDRDALGESPWRDVAGYSLLSVERCERAKDTRANAEWQHTDGLNP